MSWFEQHKRVLVLSPHTDDEMGCAGAVIRLIEAGAEVHYVALSRCEESVPAGLPKDTLETECRACTQALGIHPSRVQVWDFKVRHFPRDRQDVLERFVKLSRELKPDLVFSPSLKDVHQDHHTVAEEAVRAFKNTTVLGYELAQNLTDFDGRCLVQLSEAQLAKKAQALGCYRSQTFRPYSSDAYFRSLATVRGMQSGGVYAEAFEVVRLHARLG